MPGAMFERLWKEWVPSRERAIEHAIDRAQMTGKAAWVVERTFDRGKRMWSTSRFKTPPIHARVTHHVDPSGKVTALNEADE